jgi:hypothetical protein
MIRFQAFSLAFWFCIAALGFGVGAGSLRAAQNEGAPDAVRVDAR